MLRKGRLIVCYEFKAQKNMKPLKTININLRLLLVLLLITQCFYGQNSKVKSIYPYNKWTTNELKAASTYRGLEYLSDIDTAVLFYCNLARINPKLFRDTYLNEYCQNDSLREFPRKLAKSSYFKSLWKELSSLKKAEPLLPQKDLSEIASKHAETMGKMGKVGHDNYDKRFKSVNSKYNPNGENCDYGSNDPMEIVMDLLIDEGVSSHGHRKNILSKNFNCYGGALKEHSKYTYNYVMDFGYDVSLVPIKKRKRFSFF